MRWLFWLLPIRLFLWGVTLFLLWQVVVFVRARPIDLDPRTVSLVEQAATEVVAALPEHRSQPRRIGVVHFVNDPTRQVTDAVSTRFAGPTEWTVDDRSVIQRFLGDVGRSLARASTPEEVAFAARDVELDWVVMGRVHDVMADAETARIELSVWIYDLERGTWVYRERLARTFHADQSLAVTVASFWSRPWVRVLAWLILATLLPWLTAPLIYRVIEHKSNLLSALLLSGYGAADLLLMLALMNFHVTSRQTSIGIALALLLASLYNYWACEKIAEATR
jgi:hypothetical protein